MKLKDSTMSNSLEVSTSELQQSFDSCLESAYQGTSQLVTKDGNEYVALISMADFRQLQYFKSLVEKAGLESLKEE